MSDTRNVMKCFQVFLSSFDFNLNLRRYAEDGVQYRLRLGRAVQVDPIKPTLKPTGTKRLKLNFDILLTTYAFEFVDPIKPTLKPTGTKRLKLKYHILLSTSAFKFNLRRCHSPPPPNPPPPLPPYYEGRAVFATC